MPPKTTFLAEVTNLHRLRITLAFALTVTLALTWRLWTSSRDYPLAPVSALLPGLAFPWDNVWFGAVLGMPAAIALSRRPRAATVLFLALMGTGMLLDQTRWMPYILLYVFLLAFAGSTDGSAKDATLRMHACRLALATMYFWAGLHKINVYFIATEMPTVAGPLAAQFGFAALPPVMAVITPVAEMTIGIGLLLPKTRRAALYGALLMHAFILALYGSGGLAFIAPVWFWNFAMMMIVLIAFLDAPWTLQDMFKVRLVPVTAAVLGFFFLALPALSFVLPVDTYIAWGIFTGNKASMRRLSLSASAYERLPTTLRLRVAGVGPDGRYEVDLQQWAINELGVFTYPEVRVYRQVARSFCSHAVTPGDVEAEILGKPAPLDGTRKILRFDCSSL